MNNEALKNNVKIGFIGQGWIGKNYADNFEDRGYSVVRYALEEPYNKNKEKAKECDVVLIAVPTPSTLDGFDYSIISDALKSVGKGKTAVIKSTMLPGTTEKLQKENPDVFVMHSPEFLVEATARHDADYPTRNIIGLPFMNDVYKEKARLVMSVLPKAPYEDICSSREAELIKYGANCWLYFKVVYVNMLYDLAQKKNARWERVKEGMASDPRIGSSHLDPIHQSGRGAGGHCFIKDFSAFSEIYENSVGDVLGKRVLRAMQDKNKQYLLESEKDLDLLQGVYGKEVLNFLDNIEDGVVEEIEKIKDSLTKVEEDVVENIEKIKDEVKEDSTN